MEDVHNGLKTPELSAVTDNLGDVQNFGLPFAHEIPNFHHPFLHSVLGKFPVRPH
jgi:hypothetical protein